MTNVLPIQNPNQKVIQVDEGDAKVAGEKAREVGSWQQLLGEEEERHHRTRTEILMKLGEARREYQTLMTGLSKKYITEKGGRYFYNPELGAFIGAQSKQEEPT
jgi:hypothetical protein